MSAPPGRLDPFVGSGWTFPLSFLRQEIALASGEDEIAGALRMILGTAPGERVMRPAFGCRIHDLVFEPVTAATIGQMRRAVEEAVQMWEPRIELTDVLVEPDAEDRARIDIRLVYRIKPTNDLRNLVYPFYVIPREERP